MSVGAVVVILIVSTSQADATAPSMTAAARELLGNSAAIRVELSPQDLSNEATLERAGEAEGVVELLWSEDHSSALLHCYVTRDARWVDRRISFGASDGDYERGRLLGFAIASMFPRLAISSEPARPASDAIRARRPPTPEPEPATYQAEPVTAARGAQLELLASATTGVRGPADAIGGAIAVRLPLMPALTLRAAVGGRFGDIPVAQASTRAPAGALGVAWVVSPLDARIELGARSDVVASWLEVSRVPASGGARERRSRWMFGGAALVEGGYRLSRRLGVHAGVGVEALFGETDIYAEGQLKEKLPLFRIVGELGVGLAL